MSCIKVLAVVNGILVKSSVKETGCVVPSVVECTCSVVGTTVVVAV